MSMNLLNSFPRRSVLSTNNALFSLIVATLLIMDLMLVFNASRSIELNSKPMRIATSALAGLAISLSIAWMLRSE